jgi:hypothetical protein
MALHLIPAGVTGGYTGILPQSSVYFTPPLYRGIMLQNFLAKKFPKVEKLLNSGNINFSGFCKTLRTL